MRRYTGFFWQVSFILQVSFIFYLTCNWHIFPIFFECIHYSCYCDILEWKVRSETSRHGRGIHYVRVVSSDICGAKYYSVFSGHVCIWWVHVYQYDRKKIFLISDSRCKHVLKYANEPIGLCYFTNMGTGLYWCHNYCKYIGSCLTSPTLFLEQHSTTE